MNITAELLVQILGPLAGAFGGYVAIRADLAAVKARVDLHDKSIDRAHERIDEVRNCR